MALLVAFAGAAAAQVSPPHEKAAGPVQQVRDRAGRLRFWMDANGAAASPQRIAYRNYDGHGRPLEEGDVEGRFDASLLSRLAELPGEPAATHSRWRRRFVYGSPLQQGGELVPGSLLAVHTRDTAGSVHEQTFRRDALGRIVGVIESLGSDEPAMETRYRYDTRGRVVRIDGPRSVGACGDAGLVYRYDAQDRLVSIGRHRDGVIVPDHYVTYAWDRQGRLLSETRNPRARSGQLRLRYVYDAKGRLSAIKATVAGQARYKQTLRHDGKLVSAMQQTWRDGLGVSRRLQWQRGQDSQSPLLERVDPRSERLLLAGGEVGAPHAYAYDRNGNVLRKTGHLERIDIDPFFNQARSLDTSDGASMQIRHGGALLERVWQSSENGAPGARMQLQQAYFRGLSEYPLLIRRDERPAAGEAPARRSHLRMVWGPSGLVAVNDDAGGGAGRDRFVIGNHQASTVMVMDDEGRTLESYVYTASGRITGPDGAPLRHEPLVPYLFQGQEYDWTTGLHNYRARLYDSATLRFLAPDPVVQPGQPVYLAMKGDAVNFVDPDGRMMADASDLRGRFERHLVGFIAAGAVTAIEISLYYAIPLEAAALYVAAGPVVAVVGTAYLGYLAYNLYTNPDRSHPNGSVTRGPRGPVANVAIAILLTDQILQGQNTAEERAWNTTYSLGIAAAQIGGGKVAVAFGTPFRGHAWSGGGPGRLYAYAYLTNTLAMQPANGAVVLIRQASGRRTSQDLSLGAEMSTMMLNDAFGNACYYACLYSRVMQGLHWRSFRGHGPEYRTKGCMRVWMACRGVGRAGTGLYLSDETNWNMRVSNVVPDVLLGGAVDYAIGTQMISKMNLVEFHEFLLGTEVVHLDPFQPEAPHAQPELRREEFKWQIKDL